MAMYENEVLFVDKFLAMLKRRNVKHIPFRTKEYRDGVCAMGDYYNSHSEELDKECSDISLLFVNSGQRDFADAIMAVNGNRISLQNPRLEVATINISDKWAQCAIKDKRLNVPDKFMAEITEAFCEAANVRPEG